MQFRRDISGLRAIAVIAVVLFHFNDSWMPGGFAGVDVFFVISGFLMTGMIFRGIERQEFSVLRFYMARANRIVPALAVLCLVLLVFGWFYITPLDYEALGKHAGSSIGFWSNYVYLDESGYFDADSHEKWLLHTWSLSAEWQFYMIYPLALVAMRKFMSVETMKVSVLLATVLGLIFCIAATHKWPDSAYYLLPARAWEMLLGGVAYLYPFTLKERQKKATEWLGFTLIIGSYLFISKESPWPGYWAIFPVLGAFLIIQAQRNDSILTSNVVFQKIGTWSYSIYLWHWPLVVAIYYFSLHEMFIYLGILLSVLLGFLSNKYIEKIKFRSDFNGFVNRFKCKAVGLVLLTVGVSASVYAMDGFNYRYSQEQRTIATNQQQAFQLRSRDYLADYANVNASDKFGNFRYVDDYKKSFYCTLDKNRQTEKSLISCLDYHLGDGGYLLVGDSHGRDFYHVLKSIDSRLNVAALIESGCIPMQYDNCFTDINQLSLKHIIIAYLKEKNVKGVIFSSLYRADLEVTNAFLQEALEYSKYGKVFVVNAGPFNRGLVDRFDPKKSGLFYLNNSDNLHQVKVNRLINQALLGSDVSIIDKYSPFCDELNCYLVDELTPLFADNHHLTVKGYKYLSKHLKSEGMFQ